MYLTVAILMGAVIVGMPHSTSAALGMPAPKCDREVQPEKYFEKYINSSEFKTVHPTFSQWLRLPDQYKDSRVCINKNEKALLFWSFTLPKSLSKFQFSYHYQVALVVNWDQSAKIAHEFTPEELIEKAEALPEVNEFITKFTSELNQSTVWNNFWIGSSSYGESTGDTSPLQVNYIIDASERIGVTNEGIDSADLSIHQDWTYFPTVKIGLNLVKQALESTDCALDESLTAVSRFSPRARKNDQEPEEFIYNNYNIICPDNQHNYSMVNIYPDGRFTVWLGNNQQISSGQITQADLGKIQAVRRKIGSTQLASKSVTDPAVNDELSSKEKANSSLLRVLVIVTFSLCLLSSLVYLKISYLRRFKQSYPDNNESGSVPVKNNLHL